MTLLASVEGAAGAGYEAALIAIALLAAFAVLLRPAQASAKLRASAMLSTLLLAPMLLAIDVWDTPQFRDARNHGALTVLVVIAGAAAIAGLAALFRRRTWAFPLAAVVALPFRVPIGLGGSTANLLVPLYAVVAAGVIAHCLPLLGSAWHEHDREREAKMPPNGAEASPDAASMLADGVGAPRAEGRASLLARPRTLEWLLLGFVVLYAVQASYSDDFSRALQNVVFFYVPFALMLALLRQVRWSQALLVRCMTVSVALAAIFAGVGFVEYARKALFLNPSLVAANVYGNYFRVNSVFYDPNIYGRYLALAMLLLACAALWGRRRNEVLICAAALAWLWAGLLTSISQTSIVALLFGLAVLASWRWGARRALYATAALIALGAAALIAAPSSLHFGLTGRGGSVDNATSGRANLVRGGLKLFADRPLFGFGSGSFATQYRAHQPLTVASSTSASHTIPITVAAEQGIVGLAFYVVLALCCFAVLFSWAGRSPPSLRPASSFRLASPFRPAIAACFTALLVHTMAYADFLEDPITWALLAIGIALAGQPTRHLRRSEQAKVPACSTI